MPVVYTEQDLSAVLDKLMIAEEVVVDTETTGLELWKHDRICGIGLCFPDESTYYLPYRHNEGISSIPGIMSILDDDSVNLPLGSLSAVLETLRDVPKLIGHNIKFDLAAMSRDGFEVGTAQELEDTLIAARLYFPERHPDLSLENCSNVFLGKHGGKYKETFAEYLLKNGWQNNYDKGSPERVGEYCQDDTLSTWRLRNKLIEHIEATGQRKVWDQECKLVKVLWKMELTGMHFDHAYCVDRIPKLEARMHQIEQGVWETCGVEFNLGSTDQITEAFAKIGIKPLSYTDGGKSGKKKPKWSVTELMALKHPVGGSVLEYRALAKVKTTYFDPLLEHEDHVVHPKILSHGTVTGRCASRSPNIQNISKSSQNMMGNDTSDEALEALKAFLGARKGEVVDMSQKGSGGMAGGLNVAGMMSLTETYTDDDVTVAVRRLYVPRPGFKMYMIDYSQMEMRVFADYVNDEQLTTLLEDPNFDFHTHVAKEVWKLDEKHELWTFYRTLAKAVNFGLIYGIGTKKLASQIQRTEEEAAKYKIDYFNRFPKAKEFMKAVSYKIETTGKIHNRFGRQYQLPADKGYVGTNYLVQGTSADIVKASMIGIQNLFDTQKAKSRMLAQVHDELIMEIAHDEEKHIMREIKDVAEIRHIAAYLPTEVSRGNPSWAQKEKVCVDCLEVAKKGHTCLLNN